MDEWLTVVFVFFPFQGMQWRRLRVSTSQVRRAVYRSRDCIPWEQQEDVWDTVQFDQQVPGELIPIYNQVPGEFIPIYNYWKYAAN